MSDLSPKAKAVLDDARPFEEPPAGQQAIVREGLQARLASGAQGPAPSAPAAGSGSSGIALQAAVFIGAVAIGAGGLLFLGRSTTPPLQSASPTTATLVPGPALPPVVAVKDQEFDLPPAPPPAPPAAPEAAPAAQPGVPPAAVPGPSTPPANPAPSPPEPAAAEPETAEPSPAAEDPCALAGELAALQAARVKLEANEPAHALRLVNERSKQCPSAALGEERRLLKVMCLCGLGRADLARDEAAWLRRDFPDSPLLSRLESTCARAE